MSSSKLLTVVEAAERLGLSPATLRSWVLRRTIGYVKIGRSVRLESSEIERIISEGAIPARAPR